MNTWLNDYAHHVSQDAAPDRIITVQVISQCGYPDDEEMIYGMAKKAREDIASLPLEYQKSAYQHLDRTIDEIWEILDQRGGE